MSLFNAFFPNSVLLLKSQRRMENSVADIGRAHRRCEWRPLEGLTNANISARGRGRGKRGEGEGKKREERGGGGEGDQGRKREGRRGGGG